MLKSPCRRRDLLGLNWAIDIQVTLLSDSLFFPALIYLAFIFYVTLSPAILYTPLDVPGGFLCRIERVAFTLLSRFWSSRYSPLFIFLPLRNLPAVPATI